MWSPDSTSHTWTWKICKKSVDKKFALDSWNLTFTMREIFFATWPRALRLKQWGRWSAGEIIFHTNFTHDLKNLVLCLRNFFLVEKKHGYHLWSPGRMCSLIWWLSCHTERVWLLRLCLGAGFMSSFQIPGITNTGWNVCKNSSSWNDAKSHAHNSVCCKTSCTIYCKRIWRKAQPTMIWY